MIQPIPPFVIDEAKILAAQEQLRPLLDEIDAMKNINFDTSGMLADWVELRMSRYTDRLAEEFKVRKEKDREEIFQMVVGDITSYMDSLLRKDSVNWEDLSMLHAKLYPKGLWGQSQNNQGVAMLVKYPAGEFRKKEEFVKTSGGDFYFLPHEQIPKVLQDIEHFFSTTTELHFLVRIALMMSFVLHVHPYYNGNGTILYFYMGILLLKNGYPIPFEADVYFTNPFIGRDLALCNGGMDYIPFIKGFLQGFKVS